MKFDIRNRYTNEVQFTAEIDCADDASDAVKKGLAVIWAIKNRANFKGANLYLAILDGARLDHANLNGARLDHASLDGASLIGVTGLNDWIKCMQIDTYAIAYTSDVIQIGCQRHTHAEWAAFSEAQIRSMDGVKALNWWRKWKKPLFNLIALAPAKPTGFVQEAAE